jgi:hypothetical protein
MKQETRTNLTVIGCFIAVIGFFLPWVMITMPGTSVSINGADLAKVPNDGYYWIFLVYPLLLGVYALAMGMKSTSVAKYLIKFLHVPHTAWVLYSIYHFVVSGAYREALVQFISQSGNNPAGLNTSLALGFMAVVVGLLLSGIAVYWPAVEGSVSRMGV